MSYHYHLTLPYDMHSHVQRGNEEEEGDKEV